MKKCPYCAEEIQDGAIVCRYCGRELVQLLKPEEELTKKRERVLSQAVAYYQSQGWILISNSGGVAQIKKPKSFNWVVFIIGIILLVILAILYLIQYAVEQDKIMTLTTDVNAKLVVNGRTFIPPQPKTVIPSHIKTPEEKRRERKSTQRALIYLAIIITIIGIGGIIVFGIFWISKPVYIQPTVTNVPIVMDVPALFGKSVDEIRELYQVDESLPLQMIEPGTFSNIPQSSYMESYFYRKYNVDFYYDATMHVIGFDVYSGLVDDRIPMTEWSTALKMFNINVTSLPDWCSHDFSGNHSCSSIDNSYLTLIWWNNNGHMIDLQADYSTDCVQNFYVWPPNFSHVP